MVMKDEGVIQIMAKNGENRNSARRERKAAIGMAVAAASKKWQWRK